MALEMRPTSKWWYGRFQVGGKNMMVNLGIEIEGKRPDSITQTGDGAFERSRGAAKNELKRRMEEYRKQHNIEELTQRIIEAKTGTRFETVKIKDVPAAWDKIPRRRKPTVLHSSNARALLKRFVAFMHKTNPKIVEMCEVTRQMAQDFLASEEARGITAKTWNNNLSVFRSAFRHLQPEADAYRRYLMNLPGKEEAIIHRHPFTAEEVQAVLDAAKEDELMLPLVVTALCTAMRKGDCCLLRWKDVDLKSGFITVKTGKTGERVEIPIMPLLDAVLRRMPQKREEYVFPRIAELYQQNSTALTKRLKVILAKAGFVDGDLAKKIDASPEKVLPILPPDETRRRGLEAIQSAKVTRKRRENMRRVFQAYMDGQITPEISKKFAMSKGSVSGHLHSVEKLIGAQVIRRPITQALPLVYRGSIHSDGVGNRINRASVRGWHSFRTTWITLALSSGLPMELVRRVSGHTTTDVVLKHYFKPGREDFRRAIQAAMPKMLTAGGKTRDEQIDELLSASTRETAWKDIQAIKELRAS